MLQKKNPVLESDDCFLERFKFKLNFKQDFSITALWQSAEKEIITMSSKVE